MSDFSFILPKEKFVESDDGYSYYSRTVVCKDGVTVETIRPADSYKVLDPSIRIGSHVLNPEEVKALREFFYREHIANKYNTY